MSTKTHVQVTIISDIVCPFCFIGLRNLQLASQMTGISIQLEWEPFLLNPKLPDEGESLRDHLQQKYGPRAVDSLLDPQSSVYRAGRAVGIEFHPFRSIYPTARAHALMEFLKEKDHSHAMANRFMERIFHSYFVQGENINDPQLLLQCAMEEVDGLDRRAVEQLVNDSVALNRVYEKDRYAKQHRNVHGVPFFILHQGNTNHDDGKSGTSKGRTITFSGAQPAEAMAEQLQAIIES